MESVKMEFDLVQLAILGGVASVFTQALRLLVEHFGYVPSKLVVNVAVFVIAVLVAVGFSGVPDFGGDVIQGIVTFGVAIAGSALLIYNIILDKVLMPPASKAAVKFLN